MIRRIRTYHDLPDGTASDVAGQLQAMQARLQQRLAGVQHTLAVMSGKGGVGKSIVTANLATALARDGLAVGVADADLNGPSMARLLGVRRGPLEINGDAVEPPRGAAGVRVMSMDLLLDRDEAPLRWSGPESDSWVWRGALEVNALREFLADTAWGSLDYLILDLPPGADRVAPVRDLMTDLGGLIAVTIPSRLSSLVVGKSLSMARELELPVLGYVLNMDGYVCAHCGELGDLFSGDEVAFEGVQRLATIPFDPEFGRESDAGRPAVLSRPDSAASQAIRRLATSVRAYFEGEEP